MLHSGCVKRHQKSRDFVGLPMGLLREGSPKKRMNTGLLGSRSGEYGLNELYPKMRRIQFTLEDKEQTETVLNTFFVTDEKTVARGKEDTDFITGHFNRGII